MDQLPLSPTITPTIDLAYPHHPEHQRRQTFTPVVLGINSLPLTKEGNMGTSQAQDYESYIALAVDVFQSQDSTFIKSLKDFLTVLPSPTYIEQVLLAAVYRLPEINLDACQWLLRHPDYLMPELDLVAVTMAVAIKKLQEQGLVLGQDFSIEPNGRLYLSTLAKDKLWFGSSSSDRLLLEQILQVGD
ncbi:hypothetical protein BJP36_00070 [Moorena producens JHB]|uniref:Uncharacterized protein n=1 Tax=Moorena producens (strain JHB) TaxID=1454205 RepID=A0A1D9GA78_MOOP1|nr:hypothetical protein [Moorena producens]AOY84434.2 hypothetical protein BJP36_00070 [Moorena producens JHB]